MKISLVCAASVAALLAAAMHPLQAAEFKPAIAFDEGGRDDKSFNQAAANGADQFKDETGIAYLSADAANDMDHAAVLRSLAKQGASIIVAVGIAYADAVKTVAKEYPDTEFTIIDAELDGPNIQSVTMREQEGSFLVGMLAAMTSKTGKIGFIGGIDMPLIRKFAAGYKLGALRVNPDIKVLEDSVGTNATAWHDPDRAAALADKQFHAGADVIYAAAGASGIGVYRTAHDLGKFAIGVDTDQDALFPGAMLTSMVKRVDTVVYRAFKSAQTGTWSAGASSLGLANNAIGWALTDDNRKLITPVMEKRVNQVSQDIVAGRIQVSDYTER